MHTGYSCLKLGEDYSDVFFDGYKFYTYEKTFVAKAEPGQTHLVENYVVMVSGPGPKSLNGKKFYYFASDKYLWKATEIALKKCKKVIENLPNKQSFIQKSRWYRNQRKAWTARRRSTY